MSIVKWLYLYVCLSLFCSLGWMTFELFICLRYNPIVIKIVTSTIETDGLMALAEEIGGFYIKVVVDIDKGIMAAGAKMHVDEEQALIDLGSKKEYLWGGGFDLETKQVTYDSIINNKPGINNSSDILDPNIRKKLEEIIRRLLGL